MLDAQTQVAAVPIGKITDQALPAITLREINSERGHLFGDGKLSSKSEPSKAGCASASRPSSILADPELAFGDFVRGSFEAAKASRNPTACRPPPPPRSLCTIEQTKIGAAPKFLCPRGHEQALAALANRQGIVRRGADLDPEGIREAAAALYRVQNFAAVAS